MPAPYKTTDTVDFVVIGSGAAGGSVAKELSEAGFDVVVLEQGPYLKEKDFTHDEVRFGYLPSPLLNDFQKQPQTFRQTPSETARKQLSVGYGRQVGGGTVHFNANYWRFLELDFKERSIWARLPVRALPIGPSLTPTSNRTTRRLNTISASLVWPAPTPSPPLAPSLIRCRPCR